MTPLCYKGRAQGAGAALDGGSGGDRDRQARLQRGLAACGRGEEAGLEAVYGVLSAQLFGLLVRILQRRDLAEEALQDTFVNVWNKASEYRAGRGSITTWVTTIARNRAFDILRRERRDVPLEPEVLLGMSDAAALEAGAGDAGEPRSLAESRRLRECFERLSERQRESVLLAYFRGLTQEEIAAKLSAPLGTVKSWVRRALSRLKRCLEP